MRDLWNEIYDVISIAIEMGEPVRAMLGEHFANNQLALELIDSCFEVVEE